MSILWVSLYALQTGKENKQHKFRLDLCWRFLKTQLNEVKLKTSFSYYTPEQTNENSFG